jgi:hypothetical protein
MKNKLVFTLIILITVGFGLGRVLGLKDDIFKDFCHVWIGGMIGYCLAKPSQSIALQIIALIVVELTCFLIPRI